MSQTSLRLLLDPGIIHGNTTLHKVRCHAREPYLRAPRVHARRTIRRIIPSGRGYLLRPLLLTSSTRPSESETRLNPERGTVPLYIPRFPHLPARFSARSRVNMKRSSTVERHVCRVGDTRGMKSPPGGVETAFQVTSGAKSGSQLHQRRSSPR